MKRKEIVIKLRNVWKIYKMGEVNVYALKDINIEIERGQFIAVQGPSGSGKSTAMNMIGCLDVPTKGSVFLDGQNIAHLSESELAQLRGKKIGFVFQQFNLINTLTALENVMLPMTFQNVSLDERKEKAKELLEFLELGDRINHKPNELSGGEQQRVAIARALSNDPEIILADEPTGNLDSKTGKYIMNLLGKLNREKKKTVVMVTHDIDLVNYANKAFHLKDGQVHK